MAVVTLREQREKIERETLSPRAALAENATRQRPEKCCAIRTAFIRDRDRILYSKAFRRLMHKTQVFIAPEGDHYRTRLTHTLEVSQIARTIARALHLNEDLTEAISLGHDLGHAPFGHAGEKALDGMMKKYQWPGGFHHAQQSLRVVDFLEREGGLNLTNEVRNGIIAHTKGNKNINTEAVFEKPRTLEAQVVKISDRISYINHDIDDAIRARIISRNSIPAQLLKLFGHTLSERIKSMVIDIVEHSSNNDTIRMSPDCEKGLDELKNFMFENVYQSSSAKSEEPKAQNMIQNLFEYFMEHPLLIPTLTLEPDLEGDLRYETPDNLPVSSENQAHDSRDIRERAREVCDYIAGMTDRYAIIIYKKFFLPTGWNLGVTK
ncbi:MAG: deoxyguanosinetriphosphate triphosphohydrolase [Vulcanimicrobiota bacterium]